MIKIINSLRAKKVIVFGFPHCGTSILKSIIGHIPDVYEYPYERSKVTPRVLAASLLKGKKYTLVKYPHLIDVDEYRRYKKFFIIRNPYYVISSLNKRTGYKTIKRAEFKDYEAAARYFLKTKKENRPNLFHLKYGEMFDNNYKKLRLVLDKAGFDYTYDIFNNTKYSNKITKSDIRKIKAKPDNKQHSDYRTWQINQPFENMNDPSKIDLLPEQIEMIRNSKVVRELGFKME